MQDGENPGLRFRTPHELEKLSGSTYGPSYPVGIKQTTRENSRQESRALLRYAVCRESCGSGHRPNCDSHFHPVLCSYSWRPRKGREFSYLVYIVVHISSQPGSDSLRFSNDAKWRRIEASAEWSTSNFDDFSSIFNSSCEL